MTQAIITMMAAILLAMLLSMVENEEVIPTMTIVPMIELPQLVEV